MSRITEQMLDTLRERLRTELSAPRFAHTQGVEQTVAKMAALLCPEYTLLLRAAALLHDSTKEYDADETAAVLAREGIVLREDERANPAVLHAITAPSEIRRRYPAFADPVLLGAVRWHTTGHADMTLCEAILYLADVIEEGRAYPACIALRERFWQVPWQAMRDEARRAHLRDVTLAAMEGVRDTLVKKGAAVCADTLAAIAALSLRKTL